MAEVRRRKPVYTEEFRRSAIHLCRTSDDTFAKIAMNLGVNERSVRRWYDLAEGGMAKKKKVRTVIKKQGPEQQESEREELERLRLELREYQKKEARWEEERDILKKAAAYFAKESR